MEVEVQRWHRRDTHREGQRAGDFAASLLLPGNYSVSMVAPDFTTEIRSNIRLEIDQTVRVDVALQLGSMSEKVELVANDAGKCHDAGVDIAHTTGDRSHPASVDRRSVRRSDSKKIFPPFGKFFPLKVHFGP